MPEIGLKIRAYRESMSLSRAEFAAKLGEKPSKIQDVETGKQRINDLFLIKLADIFPIDIGDLFRNKSLNPSADDHRSIKTAPPNQENFISIPRYDVAASAGHGSLAESEEGTGHYAFNQSWLARRNLQPSNLAVIAVRGDSMEPELYDNDLILLDKSQTEPRDGEMFVVRHSNDLFVKRIQKAPGNRYALKSSNRFYDTIPVEKPELADLEFIGKVVASMHEW